MHALLQMGWSADKGEPDNLLNGLLSCNAVKGGSNHARWRYKPYDDIVTKAKLVTQQSERVTLYEKAQKLFHEKAPWVPIVNSIRYKALSKKVNGYKMNAFGYDYLGSVELED